MFKKIIKYILTKRIKRLTKVWVVTLHIEYSNYCRCEPAVPFQVSHFAKQRFLSQMDWTWMATWTWRICHQPASHPSSSNHLRSATSHWGKNKTIISRVPRPRSSPGEGGHFTQLFLLTVLWLSSPQSSWLGASKLLNSNFTANLPRKKFYSSTDAAAFSSHLRTAKSADVIFAGSYSPESPTTSTRLHLWRRRRRPFSRPGGDQIKSARKFLGACC